jgi:hypothetical protein
MGDLPRRLLSTGIIVFFSEPKHPPHCGAMMTARAMAAAPPLCRASFRLLAIVKRQATLFLPSKLLLQRRKRLHCNRSDCSAALSRFGIQRRQRLPLFPDSHFFFPLINVRASSTMAPARLGELLRRMRGTRILQPVFMPAGQGVQ